MDGATAPPAAPCACWACVPSGVLGEAPTSGASRCTHRCCISLSRSTASLPVRTSRSASAVSHDGPCPWSGNLMGWSSNHSQQKSDGCLAVNSRRSFASSAATCAFSSYLPCAHATLSGWASRGQHLVAGQMSLRPRPGLSFGPDLRRPDFCHAHGPTITHRWKHSMMRACDAWSAALSVRRTLAASFFAISALFCAALAAA